jgi:hypothetical protein
VNNLTCSIDGCDRPRYNFRGWCNLHYQRWRKHGTTDLRVKTPRGCNFTNCPRKHYAKGYCHSHWKQTNRGEELSILYGSTLPLDERLTLSINKTDTCWLWTRPVDDDGYANIMVDGVAWKAHRYVYSIAVGPIPEGLEIDHRCFVKHCVNPAHLRIVNRKQNIEHKSGAQKNSTTGVLGVYPRGRRFGACVGHNGRSIHVGYFDTVEEADIAVRAKRAELFTHDDAVY